MASFSTTTSTATGDDESGRKRKISVQQTESSSKWRTRRQHDIYSAKLLHALRLVRAGGGGGGGAGGREVRHAADRALAVVAARGRSRWSRAILASRSRRRVVRILPIRARVVASAPPCSPAVARKMKALGGLVPGCRKLPLPALLSEASDYIAALEMQVRAMAALAQALSSSSPAVAGQCPPATNNYKK